MRNPGQQSHVHVPLRDKDFADRRVGPPEPLGGVRVVVVDGDVVVPSAPLDGALAETLRGRMELSKQHELEFHEYQSKTSLRRLFPEQRYFISSKLSELKKYLDFPISYEFEIERLYW